MKRITLVIPSLTSGGAERVMTTLANAWSTQGYAVTLLTFDDGSEPPFFPLSVEVDHRPLNLAGPSPTAIDAVRSNVRRIWMLRKEIARSRPDVVLSFLDTTNVTTLIATIGSRFPVVVEEHTDPSQKNLGQPWVRLRAALYPRAARVVVLSAQARTYFPERIQKRSTIIPNPVVVSDSPSTVRTEMARRTLIALGRLGPEKGFDLLIDSFAGIAGEVPDWDLVVWGDGGLRSELEKQIERLGLGARVSLPGRTQTPHDELRKADLFVMSSRREGFPMALCEAMGCGLPVVSTDCPSGPRQVIRNGIDGVLVEPENAALLGKALQSLMNDDAKRLALAARAPEVLDRFGLEPVLEIWEELFSEVTRHGDSALSKLFRTFGPARTGTVSGTGN